MAQGRPSLSRPGALVLVDLGSLPLQLLEGPVKDLLEGVVELLEGVEEIVTAQGRIGVRAVVAEPLHGEEVVLEIGGGLCEALDTLMESKHGGPPIRADHAVRDATVRQELLKGASERVGCGRDVAPRQHLGPRQDRPSFGGIPDRRGTMMGLGENRLTV